MINKYFIDYYNDLILRTKINILYYLCNDWNVCELCK